MVATTEANQAKDEERFKLSALIPASLNKRLNLFKAKHDMDKQEIVADALELYLDEMGADKV